VSARRLSIDAGLSPSYVSKIESGEMEPSFSAFAAIAREVKMTSWELMFCILFSDVQMESIKGQSCEIKG
jgi:transcriptional regulator with XRE-family HTH domain